jgi:hypothetical protein
MSITHAISGAISLPHGASSPRLYLVVSRQNGSPPANPPYCCSSFDFGETWGPGTAIGGYDTSAQPITGGGTIRVFPNGRLWVSSAAFAAPRVTDDVTGRSGWRDAIQANSNVPDTQGWVYNGTPFYTPGASHAAHGGGGRSHGNYRLIRSATQKLAGRYPPGHYAFAHGTYTVVDLATYSGATDGGWYGNNNQAVGVLPYSLSGWAESFDNGDTWVPTADLGRAVLPVSGNGWGPDTPTWSTITPAVGSPDPLTGPLWPDYPIDNLATASTVFIEGPTEQPMFAWGLSICGGSVSWIGHIGHSYTLHGFGYSGPPGPTNGQQPPGITVGSGISTYVDWMTKRHADFYTSSPTTAQLAHSADTDRITWVGAPSPVPSFTPSRAQVGLYPAPIVYTGQGQLSLLESYHPPGRSVTGNYYYIPDRWIACAFSPAKDGTNLKAIPGSPPGVLFSWNGNYVFVVQADGDLQTFVSRNGGNWWYKTCYSTDGGVSWIKD